MTENEIKSSWGSLFYKCVTITSTEGNRQPFQNFQFEMVFSILKVAMSWRDTNPNSPNSPSSPIPHHFRLSLLICLFVLPKHGRENQIFTIASAPDARISFSPHFHINAGAPRGAWLFSQQTIEIELKNRRFWFIQFSFYFWLATCDFYLVGRCCHRSVPDLLTHRIKKKNRISFLFPFKYNIRTGPLNKQTNGTFFYLIYFFFLSQSHNKWMFARTMVLKKVWMKSSTETQI